MLPARLHRLAVHLARLPGVGEKTAMRFALHLVTADPAFVRALGDELAHLPEAVQPCARCGFLAEVVPGEPEPRCAICRDERRDKSLLCVVARVPDLLAIERSGVMRGHYFVLTRLLSPLDGIGPEDLPLDRLARRIGEDGVKEVILATPPTVDGEATALLLARELRHGGVKVSRIASGVPHGGDLEFADAITLGRSLEGRVGIE